MYIPDGPDPTIAMERGFGGVDEVDEVEVWRCDGGVGRLWDGFEVL